MFRLFRLLHHGVLFAQEIPSKLILLCRDYDVALSLENIDRQK